MSLEELRLLIPAGDGMDPLAEMLELLEDDPVERAVIDELVNVLERDGMFREAIIVVPGEKGLIVGDGRHRTAAHLRSGIGPARLCFGYAPYEDSETLRVTFDLVGAPFDGMPLRSFAVGDAWAVCDVASVLGAGLEPWSTENPPRQTVCYSYRAPGVSPGDLVAAALLRATRLGFSATVLDVTVEPLDAE